MKWVTTCRTLIWGRDARFKAVSAGNNNVCAILDNDKLKCWGLAEMGVLGDGEGIGGSVRAVGDEPDEMGDNLPYVDLGTGRTVKAVSVGISHACAILDNDKLKCWGNGQSGVLGDGAAKYGGAGYPYHRGDNPGEMGDNLPYVNLGTERTVKAISFSMNGYFACAILDNNKLKCWGWGNGGKLGDGKGKLKKRRPQVTHVIGDEINEMGDNLPYVNFGTGRTVVNVSLSGSSGCAVLDNKKLKCWGGGSQGELGYGDAESRGDEAGEMGDNLPYVDLGTGRTVKSIVSGGGDSRCALLDDCKIKCWGVGISGSLGNGKSHTHYVGDEADEMGDNLPYVDLGGKICDPPQ